MANKLTTLGYFRKRLKDCGYDAVEVFKNYHQKDPRAWTIIIDPGNTSIFCTCYLNSDEIGSSFFELYDGGQYIPGKMKLQTSSLEIIVAYLNKLHIGNATTAGHK